MENTEVSNPVKVTYALKQLAREATVGKWSCHVPQEALFCCDNVTMDYSLCLSVFMCTMFIIQLSLNLVYSVSSILATKRT